MVERPAGLIAVTRAYASARVRSELQYRASFIVAIGAQFLATATDLVGIWAVFQATRTVGGWHAREVLWLYAVSMSAFGLADMLVSAIEEIPEHIRTGRFDAFLLRPSPVLPSVIADGFEIRRLGRALPGLLALGTLLIRPTSFGLKGTAAELAFTVFAVVIGTWIYSALFITTNSVAFWLIDSREVANSFTYGGSAASHYPLDILTTWLRRLYLWVIPVGFVAWLPGTRLLAVPRPGGLPSWLAFCSPAVAMIMTALATFTWRAGIRHYESTGS